MTHVIELENIMPSPIKTTDEPRKTRKKYIHLLEWPALETAAYPTYFTAVFAYLATGEGMTHGIAMGYAYKVDDIRTSINENFGPYYGRGAEVALGLELLPGY